MRAAKKLSTLNGDNQSQPEETKLKDIETRLSQLLTKSRADWTEMAKLTLNVQQQKLYRQGGFSSFSAWVRQLAVTNDREPSLLWRFIKAAKYFLKLTGYEDLDQVHEAARIPPEALEKLEKLQRQAPTPVFETLKKRVFSGDATVAECRRIEKDYRPPITEARSNRGRPHKGQEGKVEYLGQWKGASFDTFIERTHNEVETEAIPGISSGFTNSQIASTIKRALKEDYTWMCDYTDTEHPPKHWATHQEIQMLGKTKILHLDLVGVVRWNLKQSKDLFGIKIISCMNDFEYFAKWEEYSAYCNYLCFAGPLDDSDLLEALREVAAQFDFIGILGVDFSAKLNDSIAYPIEVIHQSRRLTGNKISSVYEILYERALGWTEVK
ncbi:MAG: DNA repair protein MmcB-related protein [Calothrix sp. C42_A2020_038]|nr:DNA repair protein MmcB-related protein [Calothrix sp. C42_A2020_038]